jgi:ankyrin repeat protein
LIDAIRYGYSDVAHALLAHGVDPNSTEPKPKGRSALWYAGHWGRRGLIQDLVRRGARLPDDVLMGPVHDGDVETVRFLIRRGAKVNCVATFTRHSHKFPLKQVLLTEAIRKVPTSEIIQRTARKMRAAMTPKRQAAHPPSPLDGDLESIPIMLIKAGAEVNRLAFDYSLCEGFIRTTLGLAAHCGLLRTVKAMLAAGADVNQTDTWGGTALFDAAHEGHRQVVRILLAAGARANIRRRDGATPASIARERGFADLADEIEKHT